MGHTGRINAYQSGYCNLRRPILKQILMRLTGVFLLFLFCQGLFAQEQEINGPLKEPLPYQDVEFPQWAHDVRRYEVIMFGSFPLTYILSSLVYETVNLISTNGSEDFSLYSDKSQDDIKILLISSASVSVAIATADLIIGKIKKNKQRKQEYTEIPGEQIPGEEETK